jgi:hypothetical protein
MNLTKSKISPKQITFCSLWMFILMLLSQCAEDRKPADIPPDLKSIPAFAGQWGIQGLPFETLQTKKEPIIFFDVDKKLAMLGSEEFGLEMDSLGLRIKANDRHNAVGYFLFSEIKEHTWVGTWEDQVVRLTR